MLTLEIIPLDNGAHNNVDSDIDPISIPDGWALVPEEFYEVWEEAKPFVDIEVVERNVEVGEEWGYPPPPDDLGEDEEWNPDLETSPVYKKIMVVTQMTTGKRPPPLPPPDPDIVDVGEFISIIYGGGYV
ncbi:MAG: hypothetical protein FWC66_05140 [Oscillospiraceae bacterium]|nr:hypothetical protein [Oscillospiraceae bacterium]